MHYLAIHFPMGTRLPCLVWVDSTEDESEKGGYFHPELDQLLTIPGHSRYIGRNLLCVGGNSLRRRNSNQDTLYIWHLDFEPIPNLIIN